MFKLAKLFMSSLVVFGLFTSQAMAQDKVETRLQLFRITDGKEALVLSPRLVAFVGNATRFELKSDPKSLAMAFTTLITETSEHNFNFDHHLILDGQDISSSLLALDNLNSQNTLIIKTATGKYKLVIKTQKYTPAENAGP